MVSILVVDDEWGLVSLVAEVLSGAGYKVLTANNGHEALTVLGSAEPSLILLDWRMPVMDGRAFARELHSGLHRTVPAIVLMTGEHDPQQLANEIGAIGWLTKPFRASTLLKAVHRVLSDSGRGDLAVEGP